MANKVTSDALNHQKYFLYTEFIECPGPIQLISIGIVCDDGRTFYAESTEFNENDADKWVKESVLKRLLWWGKDSPKIRPTARGGIRIFGDIASIRNALRTFVRKDEKPEFWGYFADYDWVVLCGIFGGMNNLPKHFPEYCNGILQLMVEHGITYKLSQPEGGERNALEDAIWNRVQYHEVTSRIAYPRKLE